MAAPELRILTDENEVAREAAEFLAWLAEQAQSTGAPFRVALAGGSTPRRLYETLAGPVFRKQVDWSSVEFYFSDERCVPPAHSESNYRMAEETLLRPIGAKPEQVFRMPGEIENPDVAAQQYESLIRRQLNAAAPSWPRFHLILLGLGDDGHTASLFPHAETLREPSRAVVGSRSPKGVQNRLTFTLPLINHAEAVVFTVTGAGKGPAVKAVLQDDSTDPTRYPAKLIDPHQGRLLWFLDPSAAQELDSVKKQITYEEE